MLKFTVSVALTIVIFSVSAAPAFAWDDVGHKISAYIAWQRMTPAVRERVIKLLLAAPEDAQLSTFYLPYGGPSESAKKMEFFMLASTWPDIVRERSFENRYKKYHKSNWHYADDFWTVTGGKVEYIKPPAETGKAVEKLAEFNKLLRDADVPDRDKAVAIAWVEHLVGDIHQPLHTSARVTELEPKGDQGGNLFHLTPQNTPREDQVNLHWFWDSIVGRNIARKNDACDSDYLRPIARTFMKRYPYEAMRGRLDLGDFEAWQDEGVQLAIREVFSPDLVRYRMPSPRYKRKAYNVSEERIALAGYRMGEMFNQIFAGPAAAAGVKKD